MAQGDPGGEGRPPQMVGRYELLREIGRGGMAIVYVARQPDLDRQVALKELSRFHAGSAEYAHRFLRESRLAGSLNHPNIVTVHEYFEHATIPYIAMEYVPRGSLRPYMNRLTLSQIGGVLEGVLAGLAHGEAAGIVHRDLKPENIMVTSDGRVKITDFGIARATQQAGTLHRTATGMTVGTPTYMAPEQAMAGDIGSWSDLYSVGVMAYELIAGRVPFHDTDSPMVILMRHINERIPSLVEVRPDVDPDLSAWIDSLLVKDPKDRVHHAGDAWESLEEIIIGLLGPLWRRGARLLDDQRAVSDALPLTPAPFQSQPSIRTPTPAPSQAIPASDAFVTFDPGRAVAGPTAPPASAPALADALVTPDPPLVPPVTPDPPPVPAVTPDPPPVPAVTPDPPPVPAVTPDPPPPVISDAPEAETPPAAQDPGSEFVTYNPSPVPSGAPPAPPPVQTPPAVVPPPTAPAEPPAAAEPEPSAPPEPEPSAPPEPELEPEPEPEPEREPEAGAADASVVGEPEPASVTPVQARGERESSARPLIAGLAAVAIVIGAVVGFLVAPSKSHTSQRPSSPLTQTVSAGRLHLRVPAGWRRAGTVPTQAASLKLANAVTLSPGASAPSAALVLGTSRTIGLGLLPASFVTALGTDPAGGVVALGPHAFRRYLNLVPPHSATALSVYALPTSHAGTVIGACVLPSSGALAFNTTCEHILSSLTIPGSELPLTANHAYASSLNAIVARLGRARGAEGRQLAQAEHSTGQASAARALGGDFGKAASDVKRLRPGPAGAQANAAVAAALQKLAAGYQALSRAASGHNQTGYISAQTQIGHAQTALQAAYGQLRRDGYTVS